MVEVGGIPILVHIMRSYYAEGFNDFVICAGYRSWEIKNFFLNYEARMNHLAIDHRTSLDAAPTVLGRSTEQEKWRVRVLDTGVDAMTGARLARAFDIVTRESSIINGEPITEFGLTYGDGLCDVRLCEELHFHRKHGKIGTVLGVNMQPRFGKLDVSERSEVRGFVEKPEDGQDTINGGFFFFKSGFRRFLSTDSSCILERQPLEALAREGELMTYRHRGFWQPMDTLRDKNQLEDLWATGKAPWVKKMPAPEKSSTNYSPTRTHVHESPLA